MSRPDAPPSPSTGAHSESVAPRGNSAASGEVGAMFDRIAPVYDRMNAAISGFQEPRWRRRTVGATAVGPGMSAIDVATGTGRLARSLAERVGSSGRVVGVDVSARMIERAQVAATDVPWVEFVVGDAMSLPADDATFDAATIAFGMRNLPDYGRGFAEMVRVVRPGGRVVCLEIARPRSLAGRLGRVWFERAVPLLGRAVGQAEAYRYLVTSVRAYPPPDEVAAIMRQAGLPDVSWAPLALGMVTLHVGTRAREQAPARQRLPAPPGAPARRRAAAGAPGPE